MTKQSKFQCFYCGAIWAEDAPRYYWGNSSKNEICGICGDDRIKPMIDHNVDQYETMPYVPPVIPYIKPLIKPVEEIIEDEILTPMPDSEYPDYDQY